MGEETTELKTVLKSMKDQHGKSLWDLSHDRRLLLVFLRHFGCTFCREAVADITQIKQQLDELDVEPIFVHMGGEEGGDEFFAERGLPGVRHIGDPTQELYRSFNLGRGSFRQLFGLRVFLRALKAGMVDGHGIGKAQGDVRQMPGMFMLHNGEVEATFRHARASERPDYLAFARGWEEQRKDLKKKIRNRLRDRARA